MENKIPHSTRLRRMRAKLIFNPGSGVIGQSPVQLMDVISAMQAWKFVPEAYLVEPDSDLPAVVQKALADGIRMFVVCGGDGTIEAIAGELAGKNATLGIIPTGTRNNVAFSLGIPADIPAAIAILRTGRRIKVDMGLAVCGKNKQLFLEISSVGLLSALFETVDDIQHGNLGRIGDFLATLATFPPAEMHLVLDGKQKVQAACQMLLVSNMPYMGPHIQVGDPDALHDGLLDVLLFADLSKLDLMGYAVQAARTGIGPEDARIQRYLTRKIEVVANPAMPVMADGLALGTGPLRASVRRRALAVMAAQPGPALLPVQEMTPEEPSSEA